MGQIFLQISLIINDTDHIKLNSLMDRLQYNKEKVIAQNEVEK